jgi:Superfamily I DNA and RNA helicases
VLSGSGFTDRAPEGTGAAREKWESLAALAQLAEDMAADDPKAGLAEFVAELEERAQVQHAPPLEGVTLASLHAAKGLEWEAVFLIGLVDGTLPIIYAETPAQIEEERRLLYVGVTRAKEHLALSWALARAPGGRKVRRPSRFLGGLAPRTSTPTPARVDRAKRGGGRSGPQPCRVCGRPLMAALERKLGRCEGCFVDLDEALFTRLKDWRVQVSQALKVPPYVVFTDATLQAIAERKPVVSADLAGISGVGAVKLERHGAAILALCRGETPPTMVDLGD